MQIEPNMYVRTTYGRIYKIEKVEIKKVYYSCNPLELQWQDREFVYSKSGMECETAISKASHNIIDLIEVGDYVNGKKVIDKWEEPFGAFAGTIFMQLDGEDTVPTIRKIESVLTKEQFESMIYRVKE